MRVEAKLLQNSISIDLQRSGSTQSHRPARAQSAAPRSARFGHYLTRPLMQAGPLVFAVGVTAVLVYAWTVRHEGHWTAESGVGYWLGIAGSAAMLLLILYPLRKRYRVLNALGRVATWFRLHMVLGIVGPLLIILHCNFKLGSLNSRLALFTMLIVVASGIVGRYLYSQVHKGLYGSRAEAREILGDAAEIKRWLGQNGAEPLLGIVDAFNARASAQPKTATAGLWTALTAGARARRARSEVFRAARGILREERLSARERRRRLDAVRGHVDLYFAAAVKAQRLALFERLFALWHVLHMPLFVLLVVTVAIHILAVHLY